MTVLIDGSTSHLVSGPVGRLLGDRDSFPRTAFDLVALGVEGSDQASADRGSGVGGPRIRRRRTADQASAGTHDPWNPKGTRAGRWTVATGGPPNEVESRMTRSLAFRVAS